MQHAVQNIKREMTPVQIAFLSLAVAIVVLSGVYMYFVQKMVWNALAREQLQSQIVALNSKLSDTEFEYINTVGNITLKTATELGFKPVSNKVTFVNRQEIGKSVAIR